MAARAEKSAPGVTLVSRSNRGRLLARVNGSRSDLIELEASLRGGSQLSPFARLFLRGLLIQLIDQMPPRRDARVKTGTWSLALVARALYDKGKAKKAEVAVRMTIDALAPERAENARFRANIQRHFNVLARGLPPKVRAHVIPDVDESVLEYVMNFRRKSSAG